MGCCISTTTTATPAKAPKKRDPESDHQNAFSSQNQHCPPKSDSKSPASLEEETVKEVVLSETPISTSQLNKNAQILTPTTTTIVDEEKKVQNSDVLMIHKQQEIETPDISQVSETCSYTESFSTTTTTTTIREDEAVSKISRDVSHRLNRAPFHKIPRKRPYNGDLTESGGGVRERRRVPQSPARKLEPLQEKKRVGPVGGHLHAASSSSSSRTGQVRSMQRNVGPNRLRSPATRTVAGGVGRDVRVGGQVKVTEASGDRLLGTGSDNVERSNKEVNEEVGVEEGNESLENPHVSLECFIFL